MQAVRESSDTQNQFPKTAAKVADDFKAKEEFQPGYGDFTFSSFDGGASPIAPDVAFQNGQIKPTSALFDQGLIRKDDDSKKDVLEEEAMGPYCPWRGKAVEATPAAYKKSYSTGFSKIWKLRDRVTRSSSGGKDAYVYLSGNSSPKTRSKRDEKSEGSSEKNSKDGGGGIGGDKVRTKKGGKAETATVSAHEMHYVRNRAMRAEERRRSYLPYRPEVFGFFTSVHCGLSKNVHPF